MGTLAPETIFFLQKLRAGSPGELITFTELSALVGNGEVRRGIYRNNLSSALKIAFTEGLVYESVRNVGYRMVAQKDIAKLSEERGIEGTKRVVRKWGETLATVDVGTLGQKDMLNYTQSGLKMQIVAASTTQECFDQIAPRLQVSVDFRPSKEDVLRAISLGVS
jgi:hypothetical protein